MQRFHCPLPLIPGQELLLPAGAARHVQVLRLQPGERIELFHGGLPDAATTAEAPWSRGHAEAEVLRMGRSEVEVRILQLHPPRDVPEAEVHLLVGVPANERMDWLVEKAAELGVRSIQPLQTSRSVLRLKGDRAERRQAHWQAVAISACEQSGRTRVPLIQPLRSLPEALAASAGRQAMLSLTAGSQPLHTWVAGQRPQQPVSLLSGPEGGLDAAEEALALQQGFEPITLGAHVLRAETAPLAALSLLQLLPDAQA